MNSKNAKIGTSALVFCVLLFPCACYAATVQGYAEIATETKFEGFGRA